MLELRLVPAVLDTGAWFNPPFAAPERISSAAPPDSRRVPGSCKRLLDRAAVKMLSTSDSVKQSERLLSEARMMRRNDSLLRK